MAVRPEADAPPIQVFLDAWSAALRSDDAAALRDLVDASADPSVVARQLDRARNMAAVPFADFGFDVAADRGTGPTDVYLRYAIDGPDAAPTRKAMSIVLARRGAEWKLVSDAGAWHGPWDFGPLVATRVGIDGTDSVILAHSGQQEFAATLAGELPSAVRTVSEVWGSQWRRAVLVLLTGSPIEFEALSGVSDPSVAAVSMSDDLTQGSPPTGQRIVFSPESGTRLTESSGRSVLRHELTHVATRAETTAAPLWVVEGFADYVGYRDSGLPFDRVAPNLVRARQHLALPADADFAAADAVVAYEKAWSVWAFVSETFGEGTAVPLYRSLAHGPVDAQRLGAVLAETLGLTTVDFVGAWNGWIDRRRGGAG